MRIAEMAFVHRPAVLITFIARFIMRILSPVSCSSLISHDSVGRSARQAGRHLRQRRGRLR